MEPNPSNISNDPEISQKQAVSLQFLRQRLPTLWDLYQFLVHSEDIYLPPWREQTKRPIWVTENYLEGVLQKKYYQIKRSQVRKAIPITKRIKKHELLQYLQQEVDKPLGFKEEREPDARWLTKALYNVNPAHEVFEQEDDSLRRLIPKDVLEKIARLPIVQKRSGARMFSANAEQIKARKIEKTKKFKDRKVWQMQQTLTHLERQKRKVEELEKRVHELETEEQGDDGGEEEAKTKGRDLLGETIYLE